MLLPLRISAAWRTVVLLIAATVATVLDRSPLWLGEWNWTTDWINGASIVTGPLIGACAAYDLGEWVTRRRARTLLSLPRGSLVPPMLVAANATVGMAVQIVALLAGFIANLVVGTGGTPGLQSIPVTLAVFLACAGCGGLLGYLVGNPFAAPLTAIALFFAPLFTSGSGSPFHLLRTGAVTGSVVGLTWDLRLLLLFFCGLVAMAVLGTSLVVLGAWPVRSAHAMTAFVVAGFLLIASCWLVSTGSTERFVVDRALVHYTCRGSSPRVCLDERTSRSLDQLAAGLHRMAAPLGVVGVTVPDRFSQKVPYHRVPAGSAPLNLPAIRVGKDVPATDLARMLTIPADCPQLSADVPPPEGYFAGRLLLEQWLLSQADQLAANDAMFGPDPTWLAEPVSTQSSWVTETYAKLSACQFNDVALPR